MNEQVLAAIKRAIEADDVTGVTELLEAHEISPELLTEDGCSAFCSSWPPLLAMVRSPGMADLLLGRRLLTTKGVSDWWASGFGLEKISPRVADHFIRCGSAITPHAAAAIGL